MENEYLVLIESNEFQEKILDFIASEELDKFFNYTTFADNPECKQAMIHGMCLASMLTSKCNYLVVRNPDALNKL